MRQDLYNMHLAAGYYCGKENTCGTKVDYKSEESALKHSKTMSVKFDKSLEPYPCIFCTGWHIGREMSEEELMTIIHRHRSGEL